MAAVPKEENGNEVHESKVQNRYVNRNDGELRICLFNPTMLSVNRQI